jgi:hypothetical protein
MVTSNSVQKRIQQSWTTSRSPDHQNAHPSLVSNQGPRIPYSTNCLSRFVHESRLKAFKSHARRIAHPHPFLIGGL